MPDQGKSQPMPPKPPKSPDALQVHGSVRGVTRIGRKAVLAGALAGGLILMLILFGVQNSPQQKSADLSAPPSAAPPTAGANIAGNFGENVPLALPTAPPTPVPSPSSLPQLVTPAPGASGVASAETSTAAPPPAAPTQSAAQVEAAREAQERHIAAANAADARRQVIASAYHAPIMMAGSSAASGSNVSGAPANGGSVTSADGAGSPGGSASPVGSASPSASGAAKDPTAFLNGPVGQLANGGAEHAVSGDRIAPSTPYEVVAGSVIPAILITAINSQDPGLITGQVREDVYDSLTGKHLLIPRGSKLIGVYKNEVTNGQGRILIAWKRLIFPDTAAIDLVNMSGADVEGQAGFTGVVDTHFGQILSQTLLASIITAGLQLSQPQQATSSSTNGTTTVVPPGAIAAGSVGQSVAQTLTQQLQSQSQVPPTIFIPRGYPFVVVVDRDLVLTSPYNGGP